MGSVEHLSDIDRIHRAAKLGGAFDFINKEPLGFETEIDARYESWSGMEKAEEGGPLRAKLAELKGGVNLSGQWLQTAGNYVFNKRFRWAMAAPRHLAYPYACHRQRRYSIALFR